MKNTETGTASRSVFSGKLGYILATAGSAVGLGNIWRFPYLAAKYGGAIFLLTYLLLALTFGYTMMVSETAIGRMTRRSPIGAFSAYGKSRAASAGGWINAVIPMLILPYYSVIGGWVAKYLFECLRGNLSQMAEDSFFDGFTADPVRSLIWFLVFAGITMLVIVLGVENGVERVSKIMMPLLVLLSIGIAIYSMTRKGAAEGIRYFLIPDFSHFSWMTVVAALGQMFYSLSIAMGILITYGSYMKKDVNIESSVHSVIFFDSGIAILAGLMIIPAVFVFSGGDPNALQTGPALMFITMPKVFADMGQTGLVGILFFVLVLFAALTSAISLAETAVSTFQDELGWKRGKATAAVTGLVLLLGSLSCFGFNSLSFVRPFGMGILDFFDFLTNSLMMPVAAFAICLYVIRVVQVERIEAEVSASSRFRYQKLYRICVSYIAPIFTVIILLSALAELFGWISI